MKYALKKDYLDFVTKFVEYPLTNPLLCVLLYYNNSNPAKIRTVFVI